MALTNALSAILPFDWALPQESELTVLIVLLNWAIKNLILAVASLAHLYFFCIPATSMRSCLSYTLAGLKTMFRRTDTSLPAPS